MRKIVLFFNLAILCLAINAFAKTQPLQFIVISDIHFNPFAACSDNQTPCPLIVKLQNTSAKDWPTLLAQYDQTEIKHHVDTNFKLLKSAMNELNKQTKIQQPSFILVLGDFLSHNFKKHYQHFADNNNSKEYQAFVIKTLQFITLQLQEAARNKPIYNVLGNNDSDKGDYLIEPQGAFLQATAKLWAPLIRNKINENNFSTTFPIGGYYAVNATDNNKLRIIILNSSLFSKKTSDPQMAYAAKKQLQWLDQQLKIAAKLQQKVLLAFHIPFGIDIHDAVKSNAHSITELWQTTYSKAFQAEIHKYSKSTVGILVAHLHSDNFQLIEANSATIPVSGTPSISPLFGNNPGFKLFSLDATSLQMQDFAVYYLPLQQGLKQSWQKEYDFNQVYQPSCKFCLLSQGMQNLTASNALAKFYIKYYSVSKKAQPIAKGYWLPYYWCAIHALSKNSYEECIVKK